MQTIEVCSNGMQALQSLKSFMPDVILSDIHMAPMDGFELLRRLRARSLGSAKSWTPLIYLSIDASLEALSAAIAQGAEVFVNMQVELLSKPPASGYGVRAFYP